MATEFDLLEHIDANLGGNDVDIVTFAQSPHYCGRHLYPNQRLFLKLAFLEELDDYEEMLLDRWIKSPEFSVQEDIRERIQWCRDHGYKHFREFVLVGGRRSSKGFLTGMILAKKMFDVLQLQDPNQYYGIDRDKQIYFSCVAPPSSRPRTYSLLTSPRPSTHARRWSRTSRKSKSLSFRFALRPTTDASASTRYSAARS